MSIAVLPPTAASAMPSSVVGTSTTWTPRSKVEATNPDRSVAAPPPRPTMQSDRVTLCPARLDHSRAATSTVLACSPSGTGSATTRKSAAVSAPQAFGVDDDDRLGVLRDQAGQFGEDADADDHRVG